MWKSPRENPPRVGAAVELAGITVVTPQQVGKWGLYNGKIYGEICLERAWKSSLPKATSPVIPLRSEFSSRAGGQRSSGCSALPVAKAGLLMVKYSSKVLVWPRKMVMFHYQTMRFNHFNHQTGDQLSTILVITIKHRDLFHETPRNSSINNGIWGIARTTGNTPVINLPHFQKWGFPPFSETSIDWTVAG